MRTVLPSPLTLGLALRRALLSQAARLGIITLAAGCLQFPSATRAADEPVIQSVSTADKAVALTVDLGESLAPESLRSILATLEARNLHITFFLTGWFIRTHPDLLAEIHARGHDLANHTETHPHCCRVTAARLREELATVEQRLIDQGLALTLPLLWRPPFGESNPAVVRTAADSGYRTVAWSATSLDYDPGTAPARAAQTILRYTQPGGIILCHATRVSQQAIPAVLASLDAQGYQVLTVAKLLERAAPAARGPEPQTLAAALAPIKTVTQAALPPASASLSRQASSPGLLKPRPTRPSERDTSSRTRRLPRRGHSSHTRRA